ncbi:MAG: hypothetical protein HY901_15555 [Deltaproteobacteria bacterium]|nr:hypothetical protein [Deltaproteobacteria bacterium]
MKALGLAWERRAVLAPWLLLAAVLVVGLLLARALNLGRASEAEARRLAEAELLRAQGQIVQAQTSARDLQARADEAMAENDALRAAIEEAKRVAPEVRIVEVTRASTGPVVATGPAREPPVHPPPGDQQQAAAQPACLLAEGDSAEVLVDEVELRTDAGNRLLVGTAFAWRLSPGPPARLFGGAFKSPLSTDAALPPAPALGWGVGPRVGIGAGGWTVGVAASPPLWSLLGWRFEVTAGAGLGSGGAWDAGAAILVRP